MANSKPLLSVIVPIYNVQDYVAAALQSLLEQSFTDFEAILVEDQSSDESLAIAQRFAQQDPRFRIVQHETNQGIVVAWNTGLEHARGEYIYYFDPDDLLPHDFLQHMMTAIRQADVDIVCANTSNFAWDSEPEWQQATTVTAQEVIDRGSCCNACYHIRSRPRSGPILRGGSLSVTSAFLRDACMKMRTIQPNSLPKHGGPVSCIWPLGLLSPSRPARFDYLSESQRKNGPRFQRFAIHA